MTMANEEKLTWDTVTWQDIQSIGAALAERHPDENPLTLSPERLAELVADLPGFDAGDGLPEDYLLSAVASAWIHVVEGEDDSSPYEHLA